MGQTEYMIIYKREEYSIRTFESINVFFFIENLFNQFVFRVFIDRYSLDAKLVHGLSCSPYTPLSANETKSRLCFFLLKSLGQKQ